MKTQMKNMENSTIECLKTRRSIKAYNPDSMPSQEQLDAIYSTVRPLYRKKEQICIPSLGSRICSIPSARKRMISPGPTYFSIS